MLYRRDYKELSKVEIKRVLKAKKYLAANKSKNGLGYSSLILSKYHEMLPPAFYFHNSLFPNNYLDTNELKDAKRLSTIKKGFQILLNKKPTERQVLNYIKNKKAFFILGSIFQGYFDFGHHAAYLFKEFAFPPNHVADYLLVGKNSGGYEFIFVELEEVNKDITTKDGSFGTSIRKGLKQIDDWDNWIEANFSNLKLVFNKSIGKSEPLPSEFYEFDKSRIHYVVVAGRRKDYTTKTYRLRRKLYKESNITLLHYDNLVDGIEKLKIVKWY